MHFVYILRCADGTLYTGYSTDPHRRLKSHNGETAGGAKYTRSRRPVSLVFVEEHPTKSAALRREREIKRMPRRVKESLTYKDSF